MYKTLVNFILYIVSPPWIVYTQQSEHAIATSYCLHGRFLPLVMRLSLWPSHCAEYRQSSFACTHKEKKRETK